MPAGFSAPGLPQERPTSRGFALAGSAGGGWRIEGRAGADGPPLAEARVRRRGRGAVVLRWDRYAIAVDGAADGRVRRQVREVARRMARG